jgi:hypothetical protein
LKAINDEMFELVAKGDLPVSALHTMKSTKGKYPGLGKSGTVGAGDFDRHHLMEKRYFEKLFTGDTEEVPAYIVEALDHRAIKGRGSLVDKLTDKIGNAADQSSIYWGHIEVYEQLGHHNMARVFEKWWTTVQNLPIPIKP